MSVRRGAAKQADRVEHSTGVSSETLRDLVARWQTF
jgi:hypothetical protein